MERGESKVKTGIKQSVKNSGETLEKKEYFPAVVEHRQKLVCDAVREQEKGKCCGQKQGWRQRKMMGIFLLA